jgi:hypothetical protein
MHKVEFLRLLRGVALVAAAGGLVVHAAGAQALNPCAVIANYERALSDGDAEGALALFADDATITLRGTRARSLTGLAQIRQFLGSGDPRSGAPLAYNRKVIGNTVTWNEPVAGLAQTATDQRVEAVVAHGKIQSLVYRQGTIEADGADPGNEVAPESAAMVLEAEALLGLGLLTLASLRTHGTSNSQLRGSLLRDLRQWRLRARHREPGGRFARVSDQEQQRHPHQVRHGQA